MLGDRPYMRAASGDTRWSLTVLLLGANAVAFALQNIAYRLLPEFPTDRYFALSVPGLWHGHVWQLVSFQFMHSGLWHLLLNCLVIYLLGRDVEVALGRGRFLILYLGSGVVGGLCQVAAAMAAPMHFGGAVVGASAGAFGITAAFAALFPERPLTLLAFFVIPLQMRAKYLLLICGLIALFGIMFPGDRVAHAAHLGGMFAGLVYIRQLSRWRWHWPRRTGAFRRVPPRELVNVQAPKGQAWRRPRPPLPEDLPPDEFLSREVDPILDKISAHGIQSLTERERQILEAARKKMTKR